MWEIHLRTICQTSATMFNGVALSHSSEKGNHYYATKELKLGDLILEEKAVLSIPLKIYRQGTTDGVVSRCMNYNCFAPVDSSKEHYLCKNCLSFFCSKACYDALKPIHEKECDRELLSKPFCLAIRYLASNFRYRFFLYPKYRVKPEIEETFATAVKDKIASMFPKLDPR
jgi:hypothetical protein